MYLLNEFPVLRQFDSAGKRRAEMRLDATNDGELQFSDANENLRMRAFPYQERRSASGSVRIG